MNPSYSPHSVVLGGSGFVGSHLCDRLLEAGHRVTCVDSLLTGRRSNVAHLDGRSDFRFVEQDICSPIAVDGPVETVFHLASPASPKDYYTYPLETLATGSTGTRNALELARRHGARFLLASTSEVYGDPEIHPQQEDYWGRVNPIGPRSVYDEAKRFSEAITAAYRRELDVDTVIVRIFNTYGPRMRAADGRALPAFVSQAFAGEPVTVHGDGLQTRSFCFVSDLVDGLFRAAMSGEAGPINLGNPEEITIGEFAQEVIDCIGSPSELVFTPRPVDDPTVRRPDITRARTLLGWEPRVPRKDGLKRTIDYFAVELGFESAQRRVTDRASRRRSAPAARSAVTVPS